MTTDAARQIHLSQQTTELLVFTIRQIADGFSEARGVTAVLNRVCGESHDVRPELILLRIKELWAKATQDAGGARPELDRRYSSLIGECLTIYHERAKRETLRHPAWGPHAATGRGEPDRTAPSA
jgi:hypothetical protein